MNFPYAYLIADLVFLTVWLGLFFWAKQFRREMLIMSFITALFGPISEFWYFKDYWQPKLLVKFPIGGLEDILFAFAIGGIAAVIYEALFVNVICTCEYRRLKKDWFLIIFALIVVLSMILFNNILGLNSIWASAIGFMIAGSLIIYKRPDLLPNALGSGVLVVVIMFTIYFVPQLFFPVAHQWMAQIWKLYGTKQGILLFGHVPLTEMVWGFTWGFVWGPIYEFLVGARTLRLRK